MYKKSFSFFLLIYFSIRLFAQSSVIDYSEDFSKKPTLAWEFTTSGPIFASPIAEESTVYFGSLDSNLYALDIISGKLLWKYKSGGEIRSTAACDKKNLFFVSSDGCLYAMDKNSHQLTWKFKGHGDRKYELFSFADYFQSSPVIYGDTIYYGAGDYVFAVNKNNGALFWEYKTGSVVHSTPAVFNDKIYFGSFDGYFYALNKNNGVPVWKFKSVGQRYFPKGEMQASPVIFDGIVFTGSRDFNFYALDANKGHGLWNKKFAQGWAMAKPAIRDKVLYVGTSDDKIVVAFDPYSGATIWQTYVGFNVFGSFAFSKTMLYVGTLMGRLQAINLKSGTIAWSIDNSLFEKNRNKYFKADESYRDDITSIIKKNDDFLKMYYELGAIFSTPLLFKNYLFLSSLDGKLYTYYK